MLAIGSAIRAARPALTGVLVGLMLVATSACVKLGSNPPDQLIGIASQARLAPGSIQSGAAQNALFVEQPAVPKALANQRVAVRANATVYAYVKKAMWVDTPAHQFRALLSETIAARTGRLVLDPGQYPAQTGQVLHGELVEFGIDAQAGQNGAAIVTYDASLVAPDGQTIRRQRFSASQPIGKIDEKTVAPAISKAANEVATAIAEWVGKP